MNPIQSLAQYLHTLAHLPPAQSVVWAGVLVLAVAVIVSASMSWLFLTIKNHW